MTDVVYMIVSSDFNEVRIYLLCVKVIWPGGRGRRDGLV